MNEGERQARWLFLLAATGLAIYLTLRMLQPFLTVIIWAAVLVLLFYPLHRRFARRMSPGLAAGCSLVVVLVTVLVPIALVAAAVGAELAKVASDAPQQVERLLADPALGGRLQRLLARAQEWTGQDFAIAPDRVSELLANASETLLKGTFNVLGGVLGSVVKFFLVLFTTYFLFRDGAKVAAALPAALPMSRRGAERLIAHTGEIIHASVNGTLLIAAIQGALGGLMFWALGLPSPLVWGVVMTLLSLLPVGGSSVVWRPAALALGLTGHLGKAVSSSLLWGGPGDGHHRQRPCAPSWWASGRGDARAHHLLLGARRHPALRHAGLPGRTGPGGPHPRAARGVPAGERGGGGTPDVGAVASRRSRGQGCDGTDGTARHRGLTARGA